MQDTENLVSFFKENKRLVKDWLDTRLEIYKLRLIRIFSRSAGYLIWIIISSFLVSLFFIFAGMATGYWLSEITGSYPRGFGLTALIILLVIIILAFLRKVLFINPIIRGTINRTREEAEKNEK